MLEILPTNFANAVRIVATATQALGQLKHEAAKQNTLSINYAVNRHWGNEMLRSLADIKAVSDGLELLGSAASAQRARDLIQESMNAAQDDQIVISDDRFFRLVSNLSQINIGFKDELQGRVALFLSTRDIVLYAPSAPLFGQKVFTAFESANDDIAEAGKCLALGRGTACVMHLMRVSELGLKGLEPILEVIESVESVVIL